MHKTGNQYKRKQQIDSQWSYTHSKSKQNTEPVLYSYGRGAYFCKSRLKSKWMYQLKKIKKSSKCKLLCLKLINKINIIVNRVKTERSPPPATNDYTWSRTMKRRSKRDNKESWRPIFSMGVLYWSYCKTQVKYKKTYTHMPAGKQTLNIQQHLSATRKRKNAYHVKNIEHVYNSESEKSSCLPGLYFNHVVLLQHERQFNDIDCFPWINNNGNL